MREIMSKRLGVQQSTSFSNVRRSDTQTRRRENALVRENGGASLRRKALSYSHKHNATLNAWEI